LISTYAPLPAITSLGAQYCMVSVVMKKLSAYSTVHFHFSFMVSVNTTIRGQLTACLRHVGWQQNTIFAIILPGGLVVLVHRLGPWGYQVSFP